MLLISVLALAAASKQATDKIKKEERNMAKLPPCSACSSLVKSFEKGLERTARGKFEGGDVAWEEKNQGKGYSTSEVRFVEIQERICSDVDRGEAQCHDNHHSWEEHLEEWWALGHDKPDLRQWFCIDKLKICCQDDHYGSQCKACSKVGANGKMCSGQGKCKGNGTRKGNGSCQCDQGYSGDTCHTCAIGFFEDEANTCSPCHHACNGPCTGSGPTQCMACKDGYVLHTEFGCQDIDECIMKNNPQNRLCRSNEFCVNTDGSYRCEKCDKACKKCHGDGADSCDECAEGYVKTDASGDVCVTLEAAGRIFTMSNVRYLTYGGLLVATAIIFQRSALIAGVLGLVVASYIALSEYYLQGATGELRPVSV